MEVANNIINFFSNNIVKLRESLSHNGPDQGTLSLLNASSTCSFKQFQSVSKSQISAIINKSPTMSFSLDPVPTWLLKNCQDAVIPLITSTVNLSFLEYEMPFVRKEALITPLVRKHNLDPENLCNYHPVSNLPVLSKVIERAVSNQLLQHMKDNDLGEVMKSAYRVGHSTETALLGCRMTS